MSPLLGLSGFGGGVSRFGGATEISDEYFNYVTMLLHGDGTNGAQNTSIVDSSSNALTVGNTNNTVYQGSYTPYWDQWSNYFDGSGDWIIVPNNTATDLSTGDFTIECWINYSSFKNDAKIYLDATSVSTYWQFRYDTTNGLQIAVSGNVVILSQGSTSGWNIGTWYHVALVRSGSSFKIFRDGVTIASSTYASSLGNNTTKSIGGTPIDSPASSNAYISNFRMIKGTALYTSDFTPPTAPLTAISGTSLLTCQSNRFKDNSTNNFTLTGSGDVRPEPFSPFPPAKSYNPTIHGGSGYFPSTNTGALEQLVSVPSASGSSAIDISTGDFTFECWFRYTTQQNYSRVLNWNTTYATDSAGITLDSGAFGGTGKITFFVANFANPILVSDNAFTLYRNQWTHLAITRSGNTFYMYVNGVQQSTTYTNSGDMWGTSTPTLYIGNGPNSVGGFSPMTGWISDVRVIKGTAIYTSNFTPPTQRLTAISGTEALVSLANGGIYDNSVTTNLNTLGNAQISTTQSKFGGSSMYFDGTGDYLQTITSYNFSDYTIEGWVYFSSLPTYYIILATTSVNSYWGFRSVSGSVRLSSYDGSTVNEQSSGTSVPLNQWVHLAWTRSGTTIKLFVNGELVHTGTSNVINSTGLTVGYSIHYPGLYYYNGYIDDLRVTKGFARYTTTFTPPTRAFPNK